MPPHYNRAAMALPPSVHLNNPYAKKKNPNPYAPENQPQFEQWDAMPSGPTRPLLTRHLNRQPSTQSATSTEKISVRKISLQHSALKAEPPAQPPQRKQNFEPLANNIVNTITFSNAIQPFESDYEQLAYKTANTETFTNAVESYIEHSLFHTDQGRSAMEKVIERVMLKTKVGEKIQRTFLRKAVLSDLNANKIDAMIRSRLAEDKKDEVGPDEKKKASGNKKKRGGPPKKKRRKSVVNLQLEDSSDEEAEFS